MLRDRDRVLIMRPGAIGDFVLTWPVIRALSRHHPSAPIEFVGGASAKPLAAMVPQLAGYVDFGSAWLAPLFARGARLGDEALSYLSRFGKALCYFTDSDDIVGPRLRAAGIEPVVFWGGPPLRGVHIAKHLVNGLEGFGVRARVEPPSIHVTPESRKRADQFLGSRGVAPGRSVIALHPGAGSPAKRWPFANFRDLAKFLLERDLEVLVAWGPAEPDVREALLEGGSWSSAIEIPCLPLDVLAGVIERCALFIGNDSGITHLAAGLGVPSIALFGPTDPDTWRPLGRHVRTIRGGCGFSPCSSEMRRLCSSRECMQAITQESVREAVEDLLRAEP